MILLSLYLIVFITALIISLLEWREYDQFKKNIYYNIMKSSRRNKMRWVKDIVELHSNYSRLQKQDFIISKLKLRSITPDNLIQHLASNVFLTVPILLSLMSITISLISSLPNETKIEPDSIKNPTLMDLNALVLIAFAIGCFSAAYIIHIFFNGKKKEILQTHLAVVNELEKRTL
jgi:ABC-type amino acid transport system permease subunit